ncbi:hypothetical protein [Streptomyces sp. NPDC051554]|uniref:hypothetical protein n=1 Tax=Streptomyces sp. NPDC051554 TaxID=3365656 RepID=UPI0037A0A5D4
MRCTGVGGWRTTRTAPCPSDGLSALLAVVAGVSLAATGRSPRGLFDLVIVLNRWVPRVVAHAALLTAVHLLFRLDQGGDEGDKPTAAS